MEPGAEVHDGGEIDRQDPGKTSRGIFIATTRARIVNQHIQITDAASQCRPIIIAGHIGPVIDQPGQVIVIVGGSCPGPGDVDAGTKGRKGGGGGQSDSLTAAGYQYRLSCCPRHDPLLTR